MILLTGSEGFIGSCMLSYLNSKGRDDILLVDDFSRSDKSLNCKGKQFFDQINRAVLFDYLDKKKLDITAIIHLGARTNTTGTDWSVYRKLNLDYTCRLWNFAKEKDIPFLYASSAATYGNGIFGFDDMEDIHQYRPLNLYGKSKQDFDIWALNKDQQPSNWYGFKFFNVYGPNEYHKRRMASVIWHSFQQIKDTRKMNLFRSHREDFENGMQSRDFIYVKDVVATLYTFLEQLPENGIYNLGTGKARPFLDLAKGVFNALNVDENIHFIDTPIDIRGNYQYFTEASMAKTKAILGKQFEFYSLEKGIDDYVCNYLLNKKYY